jgi:CRISPR-associated protein Csb1
MFEELRTANRLLMEVDLTPMQGDRFQPTGFPDLGAATYQLPDGTRMLLVESAQSMANRLEATIVGPDSQLVDDLKGLPYIRVNITGKTATTTNSLIEAHRINSPWIIFDEAFSDAFRKMAGYEPNVPLDWRKIARTLFHYDINSLLHGTFLANLGDGRIKVPRALSSFVEARNVKEVVSGGVKNNPIDPTGTLRVKGHDKDVYGNVPYQRLEFTAERITAYFNVDVGLLRSYDLGESAFELLLSLALHKVHNVLNGNMRLRTACDFRAVGQLKVTEPTGFTMPGSDIVAKMLKTRIADCSPMFVSPAVTELSADSVIKKKEGKDVEEETE